MATQQAEISQKRRVSGIWFIPLLALALGAYLVVQNYLTEGPDIEIVFSTANGLEAGKTKIKYRNVDMGTVTEVRLNDQFDGVVATARLDRQTLPLLKEDTRFWVVTARVGVGNISGLETLLSGAYIQLAPGDGKPGARRFKALEQPPLTPLDAPGLRLRLTTKEASSVSTGDVVLYNHYKVGRVESMKFEPENKEMHYQIFIDAPYHQLVNSGVRFWDTSGISLSAGADGFKVETGSLDTVLLGGVSFGLPDGIREGETVDNDSEFRLYSSYDDILKNPYRFGSYYVVSFEQSIKGLMPGAPVEYRGILLGRVERLLIKESIQHSIDSDQVGQGGPIPVLIYLEPARLEMPDRSESLRRLQRGITLGVERGMRASMESGNLLTGAKYVSMDFFDPVEPAAMGTFLDYPTIPTIDTGFGQLQQKVSSILDMISKLPLDDTIDGINGAVASLDSALQSVDTLLQAPDTQALPNELAATLEDLRAALQALSPDSATYQSINSSLLRLNRTLGNLDALTSQLAKQPNQLILPGNPQPDPEPEVKP
ncbi:MAG: intermembrane transport protein PqiB [Pseudomonadota bacterium]